MPYPKDIAGAVSRLAFVVGGLAKILNQLSPSADMRRVVGSHCFHLVGKWLKQNKQLQPPAKGGRCSVFCLVVSVEDYINPRVGAGSALSALQTRERTFDRSLSGRPYPLRSLPR